MIADTRRSLRPDLTSFAIYLAAHMDGPVPLGALAYVRFPDQSAPAYAEARGPWRTEAGHRVLLTRLPTTEVECVDALRALGPI